MEISPATGHDVPVLARLHNHFRESLQKTSPSQAEFAAALAPMLLQPDWLFLIARDHDEAIGYCAVQFSNSAWSPAPVGVLADLFVELSQRGRGAGRALAQAAVREATRRGCRNLSLDTNENNPASQQIYRSLGFTCERARWSGGRQIRYDLKLT